MHLLLPARTGITSRIRLVAFSAVFGVLLAQGVKPQQISHPPRLGLEFRCPSYVLAPNQPMSLQARVFGSKELLAQEKADLISYSWEISGGKIVAGQGTPKIMIEACELPTNGVGSIMVKIKLDGGPPDLERERTCRLRIDPKCAPPSLYDQYNDISIKDEQQRLDRLGRHLTVEDSDAVAYLVAYAGRTSCFREAERRATRARQYLAANYKLDASRVITIDGGFRDKFTVDVFTSAKDTCGPFPTPSLMGSEAHITGSCADK